jgi:hypothetical protein
MKRVTQTYRCPLIALAVFALFVLPTPAMADTCTSTGSGNWNTAATWSCSHVPTSSDDVVIADGHTVTIDTDASAASITVGQGASGVLTFDSTVRSVTVAGNVTINSGGTFITQASGTATHSLSIGGDLTNNGRFDMSQGGSTLICNVTFGKNGSQTISGSGATFRFNNITLNMGTSNANVLDVQAVITLASGGLTLTNGTFKLSSASTITPFSGSTTIGSTAGFYLNHASATSNWGSTGSLTVNGSLTIVAGTMTIGAVIGNSLTINGATTNVQITGGTLNITGRWVQASGGSANTMNITGGTINVSTAGRTGSDSDATFQVPSGNNFSMSNGTIVVQNANSGTAGDLKITNSSASVTGGTFVVGKGGSTSGNIQIRSAAPLFHMTIDGGSTTPALAASLTLNGNLALTSGTLSVGGYNISLKGNWTNNDGTFTPGSGTVTFNGSSAQTIGGTATSQTFNNLTLSNTSGGVSVGGSTTTLTLNGALNITTGSFTAPATLNVAGNWTNNGTFTHNSGTVTFNGTSEQTIGGSAATGFNNLTVNSGATVIIPTTNTPTVAGTLTNNGALKQTRSVSGSSDIEFLNISTDKYYGVTINPGGNDFGNTTVTVNGNQTCTGGPNFGTDAKLIKRCYTITPTIPDLAATVKFWYDGTNELSSGLTCDQVNAYHEESSPSLWRLQTRVGYGNPGTFYYVQASTSSYSNFAAGKEGTNLVALASFTAAPTASGVLLAWQTASELDTAGFNLWRGDAADGTYAKVNEALIPAVGGPTWGAEYTFTDAMVADGATYYKLEEVDVHGLSAFHGPTAVTAGMTQARSYLPLVGR